MHMRKLPMPRGEPAVRRFIRNSLTIISLLCFIAVAVLWVRSRFFNDSMLLQWSRHTDERYRYVELRLASVPGHCTGYVEVLDTREPELVAFYRKMPVGP